MATAVLEAPATPSNQVLSNSSVRNLSQIVDHSVFLTVHFGMLGTIRKVRVEDHKQAMANNEAPSNGAVQVTTDADSAMLKAQKTLLESDELEAIRSGDNLMRQWLKLKCLPYDIGIMVLPNAHINLVDTRLREYAEVERPTLIDAFVAVYPQKLEEAKAKLGSLYRADDYVPVEAVRDVFTFTYDMFSFAVPEALRLAGKYEEQAAKLEEKFHVAAEEIQQVMRQSLLDLVTNLSTALAPAEEEGKRKRLHKSTLANINEFLSTFKARNITDDTALDNVVERLRGIIGDTTIEDLRKSDDFKAKMLDNMTGLKDQLTKLMVDDSADRKVRI